MMFLREPPKLRHALRSNEIKGMQETFQQETDDFQARNSLRIVILIDRYWPLLGGAPNNIHELGQRLSSMGFRVTVLTRRLFLKVAKHEVIDDIGIRRFGYFPVRIVSKLLCFISVTWYLLRHRREYDLVLCVPCDEFTDLLPAYFASLITKKPYVMRMTGFPNFDIMPSSPTKSPTEAVRKLCLSLFPWNSAVKQAAAVVAQSEVLREAAIRHQVARCEVIPNGIRTERFKVSNNEERLSLRQHLGLPTDKVIVINTGRYDIQKNQITLIKAGERIEQNLGPGKMYILILGATEGGHVDSNETDLKRYVATRNLSMLTRFVDDALNVEDYLRASDIFVLPTYYPEGMSNSLLEAMSCGLPAVCSDIPQVKCTFPDESGLFFPAMDIETLAGHLMKLIDSRELRESYGDSLAAFARKQYSNTRLAQQYADLFYQIVTSNKARGRPRFINVFNGY